MSEYMCKCLGRIVAVVLLMVLAASCSRDNDRFDCYLERAEKILETAPDSTAFTLLYDSIDESMLASATERQNAVYAYLLALLSHKLPIKCPKEFYMSVAAGYFSEDEPSALAVKVLAFQSELLRDAGDHDYAVVPAMQAYKAAITLKDEELRRMAEGELVRALGGAPGVRDAMVYVDWALGFVGGVDDLGRLSTLLKIVFDASGCPEDECSGGRRGVDGMSRQDVVSKIDMAFGGLGMNAAIGEFDKAEVYGDSLLKYISGMKGAAAAYADVANVKTELGKYDEASGLIAVARENLSGWNDSLHYFLAADKLSEKSRLLHEDGISYGSKANRIFNVRYADFVRRSMVLDLRNIYEDETDLAVRKQAQTQRYLAMSLGGLVLCVVFGTLFYRYRIQKKNAEISRKLTEVMLLARRVEETMDDNVALDKKIAVQNNDMLRLTDALSEREAEIKALSATMSDRQSEKDRLSVMVNNLLRGRFSHLNAIIDEYSVVGDSEDNYFIFYKNIEYELDKIRRPKNMAEIERLVDECKGGIISKIRVQLPGLREKDVTFIALTLAGLNAKAIGLFLGTHANSTYKRKTQLIKKISESAAPDKDWFVSELLNC